jgi:ABC-type multidrug transport system ATPase subunit
MKKIELKNIDFTYKGSKKIFSNFSLTLEQPGNQGVITAVMGASGAGKTTLVKLLLGIEKAQSGMIRITPTDSVISYIPQDPVLFEHLSVNDNARYFQKAGPFKNRFNEDHYQKLTRSLGLEEVIQQSKSVNEISGGQKQRLSLLRALSIEPDLILMDEPCNGLDNEVKYTFLNQLREITAALGLYIVYITHHKLEAELIADNIVYLVKDKTHGFIDQAAFASVLTFKTAPPVMEAVSVFRFPDFRLLPIIKASSENFEIVNKSIAEYFCLVEDHNLIISPPEGGFLFRIRSQSPTYSFIIHEASGTEWLINSSLLSLPEIGNSLEINFVNLSKIYSREGKLLPVESIYEILI